MAPATIEEQNDAALARQLQEEIDVYDNHYWDDGDGDGDGESSSPAVFGADDDDFVPDDKQLQKLANRQRAAVAAKAPVPGKKKSRKPKVTAGTGTVAIVDQAGNQASQLITTEEPAAALNLKIPSSSQSSTESLSPPPTAKIRRGRKSRFDGPGPFNTGKWTEEEEKMFLTAIATYGRDWGEVSRIISTRPHTCVKSHAQKHFINLWLANEPLPAKVKETGEGYTLSGKALNPDGAAVRPYLKTRKSVTAPDAHVPLEQPKSKKRPGTPGGMVGAVDGACDPGSESAASRPKKVKVNTAPETETSALPKAATSNQSTTQKIPSSTSSSVSTTETSTPSNSPAPRKEALLAAALEEMGIEVGADGKTDYARNRPKRESRTKRQYAESVYDLKPCVPFRNKPGDGQPGSQPYKLVVSRQAIAVMDLHSHLLDTEIVGLLAGTYDPVTCLCTVRTAFPAQRKPMEGADTSITVEASEESLAEGLSMADAMGLQIVGWYHSHPVFCTDPSILDLTTHHLHQEAFRGYCYGDESAPVGAAGVGKRDEKAVLQAMEVESEPSGSKDGSAYTHETLPSFGPPAPNMFDDDHQPRPFLGAIMGPYDPHLKTSRSDLTWFVLADPKKRVPRAPLAVLVGHEDVTSEGVDADEVEKMLSLVRSYRTAEHREERHDFSSVWKGNETRGVKLLKSLKAWLTGTNDAQNTEDIEEGQEEQEGEQGKDINESLGSSETVSAEATVTDEGNHSTTPMTIDSQPMSTTRNFSRSASLSSLSDDDAMDCTSNHSSTPLSPQTTVSESLSEPRTHTVLGPAEFIRQEALKGPGLDTKHVFTPLKVAYSSLLNRLSVEPPRLPEHQNPVANSSSYPPSRLSPSKPSTSGFEIVLPPRISVKSPLKPTIPPTSSILPPSTITNHPPDKPAKTLPPSRKFKPHNNDRIPLDKVLEMVRREVMIFNDEDEVLAINIPA
ncbi:hypothetical protein DFS34DRAFT_647198 [Phlyctochytrium arcticum]|nr:hypothetical protein DFS34DRAFT_647198 [Phlyctochytrium arcticum]